MRDEMNGALRELHGKKSQSRQADTGNKKMVRAEGIVYRQKLKSNQIWFIV